MAHATNSNSLLDLGDLQQLRQPRLAIVYTEWNDRIVAEQIRGCERILSGFDAHMTEKTAVPGSFEIPYACRELWRHYEGREESPEAIIAFGAVIRGGTPHFDYVCKAVTEGVLQLNLTLPIPVIFGVLTLDTEAQAWERLGGIHGHKGEEAGITALKMIHTNRRRKGLL